MLENGVVHNYIAEHRAFEFYSTPFCLTGHCPLLGAAFAGGRAPQANNDLDEAVSAQEL